MAWQPHRSVRHLHPRRKRPERRAAILIGPEYGTVARQDVVAAAREAVDTRFYVLIASAFNFNVHSFDWRASAASRAFSPTRRLRP